MSRRLSFTTITMVETMLKAATATTSDRITNSMRFVISMERKKFTCCVGPVLDFEAAAERDGGGAHDARRGVHVGDVQANAGDVIAHAQKLRRILHGDERDAPIVLVHADRQDAGHLEGAHPRHARRSASRRPAPRSARRGRRPLHAELSARSLPRMTRYCRRPEIAQMPAQQMRGSGRRRARSASGCMPRSRTPADLSPWVIRPCSSI